VVFHVGRFTDTAERLEHEIFALSLLDLDICKPTVAALDFFYPRMSRGGYFFTHDYNSPESDCPKKWAAIPFFGDKPEPLIELLNSWQTIMSRNKQ
jgi:O-methyltransferase